MTSYYQHAELEGGDDALDRFLTLRAGADGEAIITRPSSSSLTIYPDTLPMPTSFGGKEARLYLLKQTGAVGVRSWLAGEQTERLCRGEPASVMKIT